MRGRRVVRAIACWSAALPLLADSPAPACPFCGVLEPTLSQRVDRAAAALVCDVRSADDKEVVLRVHRVLAGAGYEASDSVAIAAAQLGGARGKPSGLVLAFATRDRASADGPLDWDLLPVSETGLLYLVRAPSLRQPAVDRLPYFARYLEHREALVAEDAFREFGHAPYDDVARVAECLPQAALRSWIADRAVRPERKGFYGLALGLAARESDRAANVQALRQVIDQGGDDFRAGFDGVLGGYLMLAGEPALRLIEERYLADPRTGPGDVQHALTALRFMHEFGGDRVPQERVAKATRRLLARPDFAAAAIVDLARWEDWESLDRVTALFGRADYPRPTTERAVIGYLTACPLPRARKELERLRKLDARAVADAEAQPALFGPGR